MSLEKSNSPKENVAVLGASDLPDRFAHRADAKLRAHGHTTYLVNPKFKTIEGRKVFESLMAIKDLGTPIDTVTLYVNPKILAAELNQLIELKPRRVIFNPGTEDEACEAKLESQGIKAQRACTLVLLDTGRF